MSVLGLSNLLISPKYLVFAFFVNLKVVIVHVRTLKEDQPLRLQLNLLFYHFNRSEPTYKS